MVVTTWSVGCVVIATSFVTTFATELVYVFVTPFKVPTA